MNDNENKTNAPIKLPVRYDGRTRIRDGNDCPLLIFDNPIPLQKSEDFWKYCKPIANQIVAALNEADALRAEVEGYRAMLANADSIRIPTDNDGHFTTVNKVAGQGIQTKHLAGKWQAGPNYEEIYFDTALEAYAAIKPNAAAGEEGDLDRCT